MLTLPDTPCVRYPNLAFDRVPPALQGYRRPGTGWVVRPGQASAHITHNDANFLSKLHRLKAPRIIHQVYTLNYIEKKCECKKE